MSKRFTGADEARSVDFGALGAVMSGMRGSFAEAGPVGFSPQENGPKHFRPANPGFNPTAGWDPFDPLGEKAREEHPADATPTPDLVNEAIAAARAEGFAEGMAASERMAASRGEADACALERIAVGLEAMHGFDRDALAERLRQTVLFLVSRLVDEAGISPERLGQRIDAAIALLADGAEAATLRLHPDDLPLLESHLSAELKALPDPTLDRGGFRLESRITRIEDGPAAWLAQLAAALDRVGMPDART